MKNIIITFLLLYSIAENAFANIQKLYVFEDSPVRRITVRFDNDSTVIVSNREGSKDLKHVINFTDAYHYKKVNKRQLQLYLINTDRDDYNIRKKTIMPARLNNPAVVKYSSQIFPLLTNNILTFSEDFSLIYVAPFLLKSKEKIEWRTKTNLVSPLLLTRLGIDCFKKNIYRYSDRAERNLTIRFVNNKTIEIQNTDFSGSGFSFVERYDVKPCRKYLCQYKIIKLLSTTICNRRKKTTYYPPLSNNKILCRGNIFPNLERRLIFFDLSYCMLQIDQFTFEYFGELIPFG